MRADRLRPLLCRAREAGALPALLLGVAVSLGVTLLSQVGAFAGWQTRAVDAFQFVRDREPAPEIALVHVDEDAFRELGERQPLSRRFLADLADFLLRNGARVVALDVLLQVPSGAADEDAALIATHARWPGRLVLAREAVGRADGRGWDLRPHFSPALDGPSGFVNAPIERDGIVRRFDPVLPAGDGRLHPSFALATVAAAGNVTAADLAGLLRAGPAAHVPLPTADAPGRLRDPEPLAVSELAGERWRISFAGAPGTLVAFPAGPLVSLARSGQAVAADNPFRDRLVLVGGTFAMARDFYPTPTGLMAGVEIQGNAAHTLRARRALRPPPWWLNAAVLLGTCLAVAALSLWLRPVWATLASLALVAGVAVASFEAYRPAATGSTSWRRSRRCSPTSRAREWSRGGASARRSAST